MQTVKLVSLAAMLALSACLTGCKDFLEAKASQDVSLISHSETKPLREYCVNGYRYLVHKDYGTGGLTQMWEDLAPMARAPCGAARLLPKTLRPLTFRPCPRGAFLCPPPGV